MIRIPVPILGGLGMYYILDEWYFYFRSSCRVWLETYHGAFAINLKAFDWYVCDILVLDGLAHPHNSIPYVHMGFSIEYRINAKLLQLHPNRTETSSSIILRLQPCKRGIQQSSQGNLREGGVL
jgi:hypothetical protein